jgi:hypothetical protein
MDCFVVGNKDVNTFAKWGLLFTAAKGVWNENFTHNGDFKAFMNNNSGSNEKVLILACHCHFNADANERYFYYDENPEVQLTRTEIENVFWESKCQRLFIWVLTCESANIDVWFNCRNETEKRFKDSEREICSRVIAAECGNGKKIKMTDPYILKMLECVVDSSGFSVTNCSTSYANCHLEYKALNDGFELPAEDDGYLVYGLKELLMKWITCLEKKKSDITQPEVWSTFVRWKSTDSKGDFASFQIHDHHALCSKTQKRILDYKFHAKSGGNCRVDIEKKNINLLKFLSDTGTACLKAKFTNTNMETTTAPAVAFVRQNERQRRKEEYKNTEYKESENTGGGDDSGKVNN